MTANEYGSDREKPTTVSPTVLSIFWKRSCTRTIWTRQPPWPRQRLWRRQPLQALKGHRAESGSWAWPRFCPYAQSRSHYLEPKWPFTAIISIQTLRWNRWVNETTFVPKTLILKCTGNHCQRKHCLWSSFRFWNALAVNVCYGCVLCVCITHNSVCIHHWPGYIMLIGQLNYARMNLYFNFKSHLY